MSKLEWYGYKHQNGTYHLKRLWDKKDMHEARESPFVDEIFGPFYSDNLDEAQRMFDAAIKETQNERTSN